MILIGFKVSQLPQCLRSKIEIELLIKKAGKIKEIIEVIVNKETRSKLTKFQIMHPSRMRN